MKWFRSKNQDEGNRSGRWWKRIGVGGLIFFAVKGIITTSILVFGGGYIIKGCF